MGSSPVQEQTINNESWGEFYPWYTRLLGINKSEYPIQGTCGNKYVSVETEFRDNFLQGKEVGSSVAVFANEKCVVELYGGYADFENGIPYTDKTLQLVCSCSKFMEAVGIACLADKGVLKFDDKISCIWPEFGNNGKENVTVADLMRHEGGVPYFSDPQPTFADLKDPNKRQEIFSNQKFLLNEGDRVYHAISRGWIINEIVQRVDKEKRTIGEFYEDEINKPLSIDFHLGLDPSQYYRRSRWYSFPIVDTALSFIFLDSSIGRYTFRDFDTTVLKKGAPFTYVLKFKDSAKNFENSQEIVDDEIPSANGFTNAKSLATVGAMLANKGEMNGYRLISTSGLDYALKNPKTAMDLSLLTETTLTQSGFGVFEFKEFPVQTKFYGWPGMGGSLVLFNPEYHFSFAYTMNGANFITFMGGKARSLFITAFKAHLKSLQ